MTSTHFVVPTYQRYSLVREKTIPQLNRLGVPNSQIKVFVASEEEASLYQEALSSDIEIVVGVKGIGKQRVFINGYFPAGDRIVSMDDDVILIQKDDKRVKPLEVPLPVLAERAFSICDETKTRFWGVSTTTNGFFLKHETVVGLRNCLGSLVGEYAGESVCQSHLDCCEDTEKCILHYVNHGGMVRLNDVAAQNEYYSDGGVNGFYGGKDSRINDYVVNLNALVQQYPDLVAVKTKNLDKPEKGLTRVKVKTVSRHPSVLF